MECFANVLINQILSKLIEINNSEPYSKSKTATDARANFPSELCFVSLIRICRQSAPYVVKMRTIHTPEYLTGFQQK